MHVRTSFMCLVVIGVLAAQGSTTAVEHLALGGCDDTNLNLFQASADAAALVPPGAGPVLVTPLFGGRTTPVNIAHFHCAAASIGGRRRGPVNFALVRVPLDPKGHYVKWVLTDSAPLHSALRSRGIDSHLVSEASLDITGSTWKTTWGGRFAPYSATVHQQQPRPDSPSAIDWLFSGTAGIVHVTGTVTLAEEFIDRGPTFSVPERSALRPFFDHARGITGLTHRQSFDLSLGGDASKDRQ